MRSERRGRLFSRVRCSASALSVEKGVAGLQESGWAGDSCCPHKSLTNPSSLEPSFASRWRSSSSLAELRSSPHLSFAWSSPHPHMDTLSTCASLIAQCTPADTCIGAHVHASLQTNENMPVYDPLLILVTRLVHALLSAPGAGLICQQESCLHSSWHPNSSLSLESSYA